MFIRMNSRLVLVVATATIFIFGGATAAKQKKAAPAGSSVFVQDKGKFAIHLNGQTVGQEAFDISPAAGGWPTHSTTDRKPPDSRATRVTGTLPLQPARPPTTLPWKSQRGTATRA